MAPAHDLSPGLINGLSLPKSQGYAVVPIGMASVCGQYPMDGISKGDFKGLKGTIKRLREQGIAFIHFNGVRDIAFGISNV